MEPKWRQIGTQNVPKIEVSKKSAEREFDPLFTMYNHYRHPAKPSLFGTSEQPKRRSTQRGASDTAPGLQNDAPGPEKWREWVPRDPQGCQRVSQCLPKCSKKSSKISTPRQECLQGCSQGASGTPPILKCHF